VRPVRHVVRQSNPPRSALPVTSSLSDKNPTYFPELPLVESGAPIPVPELSLVESDPPLPVPDVYVIESDLAIPGTSEIIEDPLQYSNDEHLDLDDNSGSKLRQFKRQFGVLAVAEVLGVAIGALVVPIATRRLGPHRFGEYIVAYRMLTILQPVLLLGTGVALTRTMAQTKAEKTPGYPLSYVAGALAPVLAATAVIGVTLVIFDHGWSQFMFGNASEANTAAATGILIAGSCFFGLIASALRGMFEIPRAALLYVLYSGVVPLFAMLVSRSLPVILLVTGSSWIIATIAVGLPSFKGRLVGFTKSSQLLIRYGFRRVPGEIAFFALLFLPPIIAVHVDHSVASGGYVALAMSLVTFTGALCTPAASLLLPHASRSLHENSHTEVDQLWKLVNRNARIIAPALVLGAGVCFAFAPLLLRVLLGSGYQAGATDLRYACLALPPYGLYVTYRGVLDGYYHRAVSMRFATYAMVSFLAVYGLQDWLNPRPNVMIAFVTAMWLLFALTVLRLARIARTNPPGGDEGFHPGREATLPVPGGGLVSS
jgi:O-antigen/teichoic acid export membrane protein